MDFSVCKGADPDIFVLKRGYTSATAKSQYCSKCPVTAACLDYGIRTDSVGVWGGVVLTLSDDVTELFPYQPIEAIKVEPISAAERKRTPSILGVAASFRHPSILGSRDASSV